MMMHQMYLVLKKDSMKQYETVFETIKQQVCPQQNNWMHLAAHSCASPPISTG
jgi:hypothetical protein